MDREAILGRAAEILRHQTPRLDRKTIENHVARFLEQSSIFLKASENHGSPLYIIDTACLTDRAERFREAFEEHLPRVTPFFAVKSNNHPFIGQTLTKVGFGLDVSSGTELESAIALGASNIIFSGPGKTPSELERAALHSDRVTVLLDSFGELNRIEEAAERRGCTVNAGVRLTTEERGLWRKFGIPLGELPRFFSEARDARHVRLRGLQFHTSWNLNPGNQIAFIERVGRTLRDMKEEFLRQIEFLDIGGGYWPPEGEWLHAESTPEGRLRELLGPEERRVLDHRYFESVPIDVFASRIAEALEQHIFPILDCDVFVEPGRWICNNAMHILLTVVDKKADDLVITDGGTNALGWERFETDYFPVINVTRPSREEIPCLILGSLCTPHDVWGYACFGEGVEEGDVLLIPDQGAYTYSLRQNFIKPLPRVVILDGSECITPDFP